MLFILTGEIQTGKTRWLQDAICQLEALGTEVCGVIAPGDWAEHTAPNGAVEFEKLGIFNELLPQHDRIVFARRDDLVEGAEREALCTQASQAKLSWAISDEAIEHVNAHLARIACATAADSPGASDLQPTTSAARGDGSDEAHSPIARRLLVIDELGRLELLHSGGLAAAMALIDRGATPSLPHALIVVREQLLQAALERFKDAPWSGIRPLHPSPEALTALLELTKK